MGRPTKNQPPPGSPAVRCNKCSEEQPAENFYWKVDGTPQAVICKTCWKGYHAKRGGYAHARTITCTWCGATKEVMKAEAAFCSRQCKDDARRAAERSERLISKASQSDKTCPTCGDPLTPRHRADATFCSIPCSEKAHNVTRKIRRRVGESGPRPRKVPLVSLAAIGDRDGWLCGICGGHVDKAKRHPEPLAASIDHVVPIRAGGSNDLDNLQLAHFVCNWRKGGRSVG